MLRAWFILLGVVVALPLLFAARAQQHHAAAQHALLIDNQVANLFAALREGENGSRGYLLTGSATSLHTFNISMRAEPQELAQLDAMVGQGPERAVLPQVHALCAAKLAQLAAIMARLQAGDKAGATALIADDLTLNTMVQLRDLVDHIRAGEHARFTAAEAAADLDGWLLFGFITAAALMTALLGGRALRTEQARSAALAAAQSAMHEANEALERKVAERTATLAQSEARFRSLAESLPSFVYMTDAAGKTIYVSPQSAAYASLSVSEMLEFGWTAMVHPDDRRHCLTEWARCLASGDTYEMEYRLRGGDGSYRWFIDRAVPQRDAAGWITGWVGSSTDIDERKRAEAVLASAHQELERHAAERAVHLDRIFHISSDILTVSDEYGRFSAISPAWERILGYPVAAWLEQPYDVLIHPEDVALTQAARVELTAGRPVTIENRWRRADGGWCVLAWRAVPDPQTGRVFGIARDITEERARTEQLRQSQKMEVVGQLTGGVAHDFNNLLTIIMGSLELLQRGLGEADKRLAKRVETAVEAARRAATLTHRLLAFSRRQPLEPKSLDVGKLLAGMSELLHRTLGEAVDVEIVGSAGLWPALVDANQLENAILNLGVNARDAMRDGGRLSIETQNVYIDEDYAATSGELRPGQYVLIAVADTGSGMPAEVREKIFEPFFTTKPVGQGTGLGLAQVYGFIKQSGGHISVYSEPGEGTVVKLYLPRASAAPGPELPPPARQPAGSGQGASILVVEDEEAVRQFAEEVLAELGYRVFSAATAEAALAVLEAEPGIDLLFTDVVLGPGMNGRRLAEAAQARCPGLTVLYTTGYTRNAIIHHGRLDEGVNFIGKPFTAAVLAEKIAQLLRARRGARLDVSSPAPH